MSVAEDSSEEHGEHHLPAVEDWPRGFGEASWWPFVTAIGAAGIYVAAGGTDGGDEGPPASLTEPAWPVLDGGEMMLPVLFR